MNTRPGGYRRARKTRDRAMALPLIGLILLMPPFALIFHSEAKIFGLPATLLYVFLVWAALILVAFWQARPLQATNRPEDDAS